MSEAQPRSPRLTRPESFTSRVSVLSVPVFRRRRIKRSELVAQDHVYGLLRRRSTSNSVYGGTAFETDVTSYLGYHRPTWFVAGLPGYDRTFVTHLEHSDWCRRNIYGDAVDGRYQGGSRILQGASPLP